MKVRGLVRGCVLDLLGAFAKPVIGVHILNGHMICQGVGNQKSKEKFHDLLSKMSKNACFINIEEAVDLIIQKRQVNYPLVAFTFDDGFMDCYSMIAPVLENFGINAAFFINPNFAEGDVDYIHNFTEHIVLTPDKAPMRWEEIQKLHNRGHIIGAHTMDHYMINTEDTKELEYQIGNCKLIIEEKLGTSCDYFAFPYGKLKHVNAKALDIACDNYKYVFSQSNYKNYFSFEGRVINRRHFEPFWPITHVYFFLSCHKKICK